MPVALGLTRAAVIWIHRHILHFATSRPTLILRKMIQRSVWLVHCRLRCASGSTNHMEMFSCSLATKSLTQKVFPNNKQMVFNLHLWALSLIYRAANAEVLFFWSVTKMQVGSLLATRGKNQGGEVLLFVCPLAANLKTLYSDMGSAEKISCCN